MRRFLRSESEYGGYPPTEGRRRRRSLEWWQPNPYSVRESAYDASCENRQNFKQKRNTMVALRGQSTWRVFIIHVFAKAFGDASHETW